MTCPSCKDLMEGPTPEEPFWFCWSCGKSVPELERITFLEGNDEGT